jgi:hypothetical protein
MRPDGVSLTAPYLARWSWPASRVLARKQGACDVLTHVEDRNLGYVPDGVTSERALSRGSERSGPRPRPGSRQPNLGVPAWTTSIGGAAAWTRQTGGLRAGLTNGNAASMGGG